MQEVNGSLYVYQEVMESCGELVQPTEYTELGQVCNQELSSNLNMQTSSEWTLKA